MDVIGKALLDYWNKKYTHDIITSTNISDDDELPLPYLFRNFSQMPAIEQRALQLCSGKVLDIGCGAGSHSLYLQKNGLEVMAIDISEGACAVAKARGVSRVENIAVEDFNGEKFDTLLLMMNGIGLAGTLSNLNFFLKTLVNLLNSGGQILLDSSDIKYMYLDDEDGGYWMDLNSSYYGELTFEMRYKKYKSQGINWLYIDFEKLSQYAAELNLNCELIASGEHYDYLARLSLKS